MTLSQGGALGSWHLRSSVSVSDPSVLDAEDDDFALSLVDSIQGAVGATPRRVDADEVAAKLFTDVMRVLDQCSGEELDDRRGHALGQSGLNGADGGRSQDEFV